MGVSVLLLDVRRSTLLPYPLGDGGKVDFIVQYTENSLKIYRIRVVATFRLPSLSLLCVTSFMMNTKLELPALFIKMHSYNFQNYGFDCPQNSILSLLLLFQHFEPIWRHIHAAVPIFTFIFCSHKYNYN